MLLLMPRLVGRAKKLTVPPALASFGLAPRHLTLLALLLLDGPMTVRVLAERLEVAPATVSLMVGDLSRQGILHRGEDDTDRRRVIVSIAAPHRRAIHAWLAGAADAWRAALEPLTAAERGLVVATLRRYEEGVERSLSKG
ncbi:MarR family winged helix-turn-helix transcriptional regulator [Actinocatenispora thailandica]